jgi:hypothetical protein
MLLINSKLPVAFLKSLSCFAQLLLLVGDFELERYSNTMVPFVRTQGQTQAGASELTSDQVALERAGKKQVLKVRRRPDFCHFQLPDYYVERMELLGRTRVFHCYVGHLGGYECSILCRIH